MYRIIYFVGMLVRQFLLPNPFTPLGTMGELINLVSSVVLMPLSYFQVSLIYTSGSAPALGSILFTVMYAVNTGVIYLIMSRTIPRAYVTAAWSKNRVDAEDQARKYCSELAKAGYLPLCPVLAFSGIIAEDDPDGEKKRREMSEDLLKRARFLVVCGKKINDDVKADISIAKHSKVIPTTLEGVLECGEFWRRH